MKRVDYETIDAFVNTGLLPGQIKTAQGCVVVNGNEFYLFLVNDEEAAVGLWSGDGIYTDSQEHAQIARRVETQLNVRMHMQRGKYEAELPAALSVQEIATLYRDIQTAFPESYGHISVIQTQ